MLKSRAFPNEYSRRQPLAPAPPFCRTVDANGSLPLLAAAVACACPAYPRTENIAIRAAKIKSAAFDQVFLLRSNLTVVSRKY